MLPTQTLLKLCMIKANGSQRAQTRGVVELWHLDTNTSVLIARCHNSSLRPYTRQGIIDMNRKGNSTNFFSHVCNDKKSKELFASTLNGITISVRCVSSIIVVLNDKLTRLIAAHTNKRQWETKNLERVPFFASWNT